MFLRTATCYLSQFPLYVSISLLSPRFSTPPTAFYSAVRECEQGNQPLRNLKLRATVVKVYNTLVCTYYTQEDAICFYSTRRAAAVTNLHAALQEAEDKPEILDMA